MCVLSVCDVRLSVNISETVDHVLLPAHEHFWTVCKILEVSCSLHSLCKIGEATFFIKLNVNYNNLMLFHCCVVTCAVFVMH